MSRSLLHSSLLYFLSLFSCQNLLPQQLTETIQRVPTGVFNWSSIVPSSQLKWVDCYERHQCARLEVPYNWHDETVNESLALAVIRDPVSISRESLDYGGSIFLNPGGPGGSGIDFLRWTGYEIRSKITGTKHFDLVSWDPRGVGETTPMPVCFKDDLQRQLYWQKQEVVGLVDESDYAMQYNRAAAQAFGQACNSTVIRYMTTYAVSQDIVAIADALEPNIQEPLINFWGTSYGTLIGNTLASAFPHRIGKFVLDGVVGTEDYLSGAWYRDLADAERALTWFYTTCHRVGPRKCPIFEASPDLIRNKVESLLSSVRDSPIPVYDVSEPTADILTSAQLRIQIFRSLYTPHRRFGLLAQTLHSLLQSPPDTTLIAHLLPRIKLPYEYSNSVVIQPSNNSWDNPLPSEFSPRTHIDTNDVERIIVCTDAEPIFNWTTHDLQTYIHNLTTTSPLAAGYWAQTALSCTGWPPSKRAPSHLRFTGPFGSNLSSYSLDRGARPILFIGNEVDPVTPLMMAREESSKHEGSVVLKTDIVGHASVPGTPSRCVWEVLKRYWNEGVLPDEGTVCAQDEWEWEVHL